MPRHTKNYRTTILLSTIALSATMTATVASADSFLDVGEQEPITILINSSPWYPGFETVVDLYEEQTGNEVNIDVTPYGGVLERARNAVRSPESPYDIVNLDGQWTIEFYEGDFLTPFQEIDPNFELPPEVLTYGDSGYWNADLRWRTSDGGQLLAYSPNGNIHLFFYRGDLYDEAGLDAPETWDDVIAACETIGSPPDLYGAVMRGERGNPIRFSFSPILLGHGGSIVRDPQNGDYTVTINSQEALEALNFYLDYAGRCAPPNVGAIGQGDMIQLLNTGTAAQGHVVVAAWPNFDDPTRSAVVGLIQPILMPRPADGDHGVVIGNWHFGIPRNVPAERQQAAVAFSNWFLTEEAQYAYAEAGGIPVRSDVYESDLADQDEFRWMGPYLDSMPYAQQMLGYAEGAAVEQALGLRLNQALVGEMTPEEALNQAAEDIAAIFEESGRETGTLPPL